jgi:hypothetical protein
MDFGLSISTLAATESISGCFVSRVRMGMATSLIQSTMATPFQLSNRCFGLVSGALFGLAAAGQAAPVHCPEQIKVEQRAVDLPVGLRGFDSSVRHLWVNVQFSDGSPDEQAWLAPDSTRSSGKSFINVWRFTASASIWLACGYTGTSMVAAFRLADGVRACEVHYDATFSPPAATSIDCR